MRDTPTFDAYAGEITVRQMRRVSLVILVAALVWSPVKPVLFADPFTVGGIAAWRIGVVIVTAAGLLAMRLLPADGRASSVVGVTGMCLNALICGLGGPVSSTHLEGYLELAVMWPFSTLLVLCTWPVRLAITMLITACYVAPLLLLRIGEWELSAIATPLYLAVFAVVVSTVFGASHYRTVRQSHAQQMALDQRSRELEELDRLKNDFFANVSHELRTPLALILAMLRELRAVDAPGVRPRVETAERNAARLLVMIDELLQLARFTSGRAAPKPRAIDVAQLTRDVAASFRTSEAGALTLSGCEEPLIVHADPRQLRTALHNLLSNAHKFTDPGRRQIEVAVRRESARVEIAVTDNGIGIPSAARDRVFERFFQVEGGRGRSRGGAGIGLALVRDIASAHGGEVRVESTVGRGSTFTIEIPIGASELDEAAPLDDELAELHRLASAVPGPAPRHEPSGLGETILVAEDDPELRAYLERLLGARHRVLAASNGAEALACLEHTVPALVVTDAMMPGTSGFDLARRMREDPRTRRVPVLFLTARVGAAARAEAYEAGAEDFLQKPFEPEELLARVSNLLALRATERELAEANGHLEEKVRERTARLRELALHLERSREDERRRIARDLHDETGQLLTALRMELDLAHARADEDELEAILARMGGVLEQAFEATRALVGELRPRILDDLGLGPAVEWYVTRFDVRPDIRCELTIEPHEVSASPEIATAVFRILQESLTNVARHSRASAVRVRLERVGQTIELEVADDGRGFDPHSTRAGYGLLGMRERAEALGGSLEILSAPGAGSRVCLRLPEREPAA